MLSKWESNEQLLLGECTFTTVNVFSPALGGKHYVQFMGVITQGRPSTEAQMEGVPPGIQILSFANLGFLLRNESNNYRSLIIATVTVLRDAHSRLSNKRRIKKQQ